MTFTWPHLLWFLLLVPILVWAYLYLLRRKKKVAIRFSNLGVVKEAMGSKAGIKRHIPPVLFLFSLVLIIIAVARPAAMMTLPSERATIILAMDISLSMQVSDISPDRITASQYAVKTFIEDQPRTTRFGIVAFAGEAMLVQPPTHNREEVLRAIDRFQLQRGTNLGGAILESLTTLFPEGQFDLGRDSFWSGSRGTPLGEAQPEESFVPSEPGSHPYATIVLLTDGRATTGPDPVRVARMAADRGVRIFTVGFGIREGTSGYANMSIYYQLDEETLQQIADITHGKYFHAESATDLGEVYQELGTQFLMETEKTEITAIFSAAAALFFLSSVILSIWWFKRLAG